MVWDTTFDSRLTLILQGKILEERTGHLSTYRRTQWTLASELIACDEHQLMDDWDYQNCLRLTNPIKMRRIAKIGKR